MTEQQINKCPLCRKQQFRPFSKQHVKQIQKWARKGKSWALSLLGDMYKNGKGVDRSLEEAMQLYTQAAAKGDDGAMSTLGEFCQNGVGSEIRYDLAREWYEKSAELGNPHGMRNLALLHEKGLGVAQCFTKAFELMEQAVALECNVRVGTRRATLELGRMYGMGRGCEVSSKKARELLTDAAAHGEKTAVNALKYLDEKEAGGAMPHEQLFNAQACAACHSNTHKLSLCPCGTKRYCTGKTCQKDHWPDHKVEHRQLRKMQEKDKEKAKEKDKEKNKDQMQPKEKKQQKQKKEQTADKQEHEKTKVVVEEEESDYAKSVRDGEELYHDKYNRCFCTLHKKANCISCGLDFTMLNEMMEEQCGLRKERTEIEKLFEQYAELEAALRQPAPTPSMDEYCRKRFKEVEGKVKANCASPCEKSAAYQKALLKVEEQEMERHAIMQAMAAENPGQRQHFVGSEHHQRAVDKVSAPPTKSTTVDKRTCTYCQTPSIKKLQRCSRCEAAYFCDSKCQRAAWNTHRDTCVPISDQKMKMKMKSMKLTWAQVEARSGATASSKTLEVRIMCKDDTGGSGWLAKDRVGSIKFIAAAAPIPGCVAGCVLKWKNPKWHIFGDGRTGGRIEESDLTNITITVE